MRILELLMQETLPHRNFFRASEVSTLLNIKPHEIHYWETEFPQIRPQKTKTGQRIYRRQDLILFSAIKNLIQDKKLTIPAAQRIIAESDEISIAAISETNFNRDAALANSPVMPNQTSALVSAAPEQTHEEIKDSKPMSEAIQKDRFLEEAAELLYGEDDEFDELTHKIYQQCATELDHVTMDIEVNHVGEMLHNALAKNEMTQKKRRMSKLEYERAVATLMESKNSLTAILTALEKYHESEFFSGFKA